MRVIVHIGHYKTGTTSLQQRFSDNRSFLAEHGIVYPELATLVDAAGLVLPSHSPFAFAMFEQRGFDNPAWYRNVLEKADAPPTLASMQQTLRLVIEQAIVDDHDVVLSSEEFMRFGAGGRHDGLVEEFGDLLGDVPVEVFCHVRRPDLYLRSWYNQMIKLGALRPNMSEHMPNYFHQVHVDLPMALRPWVERFGRDHVTVRRYEDRVGDVSDDLLRTFGHDLELPAETVVWANERFPDVHIETLRLWNWLRPPDHLSERLRQTMIAHAEREGLLDQRVEFMTPAAKQLLHDKCVEVVAELDRLLGDRSPRFDDLEAILEPIDGAITDQNAHLRYSATVLDEAFTAKSTSAQMLVQALAPVTEIEATEPRSHGAKRLTKAARRAAAQVRRTVTRRGTTSF